jgi:drug/metabolite transporter (DMT)-like permease
MRDKNVDRRTKVALALAAVYLIWGSSYLATKIMVTDQLPLVSAGIRFVLAGLIVGIVAWWRGSRLPRAASEWRHALVLGLLLVVISNGCNTLALQHVQSNVSALLNASPALWIAWLGTFGRNGVPLSASAKAGLVLGFVGVALIFWPAGGVELASLGWQLVVLVGCFGWSLGTIYLRNAEVETPPMMMSAMQMALGGMIMLLLSQVAGEPLAMHWTLRGFAAFLWLTIMSSCVAYSAYYFLVAATTPAVVGTYGYVNPVIAVLLGWVVLGEALSAPQAAGVAIVLVSVALVTGYFQGREEPHGS